MELPVDTVLHLWAESPKARAYSLTSHVLGPSRWGVRIAVPRILHQTVSLPAQTKLTVACVPNNVCVEFDSTVMGYDNGSTPAMVIEAPKAVSTRERRDSLRLPVQFPVSFLIPGDRLAADHGQTINVSQNGICLQTYRYFKAGTDLLLFVETEKETLTMKGTVRWCVYRQNLRVSGLHLSPENAAERAAWGRFVLDTERALYQQNRHPGIHRSS